MTENEKKKGILTFIVRISDVNAKSKVIAFDLFCGKNFDNVLTDIINEDMAMLADHFQALVLRLVAHVYIDTEVYRKLKKADKKILTDMPIAVFDQMVPQKAMPIQLADKLKKPR